jgi:hypothetical protein
VLASKAEIDRRIAAFIAGKREENNRLNVIEFCRRSVVLFSAWKKIL